MSNMLDEIIGEREILTILEELKHQKISVREAFEQIREIFQINLELFSVKKNVHNVAQVTKLITAKLFPSYWGSIAIINKLNRGERISFTDDDDFGKRTTESGELLSFTVDDKYPPAITRGCSVLLLDMHDEIADREIKIVIDELRNYIKSTGDLPRPEDVRE